MKNPIDKFACRWIRNEFCNIVVFFNVLSKQSCTHEWFFNIYGTGFLCKVNAMYFNYFLQFYYFWTLDSLAVAAQLITAVTGVRQSREKSKMKGVKDGGGWGGWTRGNLSRNIKRLKRACEILIKTGDKFRGCWWNVLVDRVFKWHHERHVITQALAAVCNKPVEKTLVRKVEWSPSFGPRRYWHSPQMNPVHNLPKLFPNGSSSHRKCLQNTGESGRSSGPFLLITSTLAVT